jgi:dihydropyrimidine dehydrogenase (NAD+) subunit PreT
LMCGHMGKAGTGLNPLRGQNNVQGCSDSGGLPHVYTGYQSVSDSAVQAKLLGAEDVTICYRRGQENMNASPYEQELATSKGVTIRHWLQPKKLTAKVDAVASIELEYTEVKHGKLVGTGVLTTLPADQIFRAIGQSYEDFTGEAVRLKGGRIQTADDGATSLDGVWAGGDCTGTGDDLTVTAVAQGRDAAEAINKALGA